MLPAVDKLQSVTRKSRVVKELEAISSRIPTRDEYRCSRSRIWRHKLAID